MCVFLHKQSSYNNNDIKLNIFRLYDSPLLKFLFSTFPFWSLPLWNGLESISCSSLTSDQSSSSSLANFVTVVWVTRVSNTLLCWGLVEKDCLTAACLARTGVALLDFAWTGTAWFWLACCDLPLCCFCGSSSSDSSSELKGGVLEMSSQHFKTKRSFKHEEALCLSSLRLFI